jgi:hypothetical protein
MTIGTTTALNIIQTALRRINSYQSGEPLATPDENDALEVLNDLLDSLSTDHQFVFGANENIFNWVAGQKQYRLGNPVCTLLGASPFTGTLTSGSPTITGVTNMPANLVAGAAVAYAQNSGSILTDVQGLIPANATVIAFNSGAQTVTMSANAIGNSAGLDSITFTVPGDFPMVRPLRLTSGYTRFNNLDFTLDIAETQQQYNAILYKAQPGPWPVVAWYDYTMPYGLLNVYQTPGNGAEVHIFSATILGNLTLNQILVMPQGYNRALKWLLARELWTEFMGGSQMPQAIEKLAGEAAGYIKALNAAPQAVGRYESSLTRGNRPDGGWITHGGYR